MSVSPFRDTVTLCHTVKTGSGETCARRVIERVKCIFTGKDTGEDTAVLYIPIYGKRELVYVLPWDFPPLAGAGNAFTVSAGDRFVYGLLRRCGAAGGCDDRGVGDEKELRHPQAAPY